MGGIGKTELALQYAHFHLKQKTYKGGICWLDCRDENVGLQIVGFTNSQFNLQIPEEYDLQTRINFCWGNWPQGDVLIIFDDVVDYNVIKDCIPPGNSKFKTIITTRKKWLGQSFEKLELEVLDLTSALDLLISFVGNSRINSELQEAEELCKYLGFLPLGLELVARYLERKPGLTLAEVRKRLRLEDDSLKLFSTDMTATRGVAAAFELSWNELDEDSKTLGCLLSLFASAPIPWDLVEKCLLKNQNQEKGIIQLWFPTFLRLWLFCFPRKVVNVLDLNTWKNKRDDELINFSLLQYLGGNNYGFHPLIRDFFQNKLSGLDFVKEMKRNICQIIAGVARKIPYSNEITVEQVKVVEINIPHIKEIADNLAEYLNDDDLTTPFIRLGWFYQEQGLYPLAQPWLEKVKEIAEKRLDKNNPNIAAVYNNLAELHKLQGKYEKAETLYLQAIKIHKIALPKNHPNMAAILNNLAELYQLQGKYEKAETLYLQAIEIDKIVLPENHPRLAAILNNLASLYYEQGKYEKAEPLFLETMEINKIALPKNHPNMANSLNNLASLYESQGKYEKAETLYLQAIEIDKIALPKYHPQLAAHLNNLATLYREQGKHKEAKPLCLQAIEIDKIALPENHPSIAKDLNNLAGLYKSQGKYEEAEPLYLKAIEILKQSLGEEHPDTQTVIKNYQIFLNKKNNEENE